MRSIRFVVLSTVFLATLATPAVLAAEPSGNVKELQFNLNVVWTCVAAFLVFFMQAGFAMVETGFTRSKNAVNILMKNLMDFSIGSVAFFLVGFGLMFGASNGFFGHSDFVLSGTSGNDWNFTFLIFQTVFCATAATIVSGAMAERTRFSAYLVYSFFISLVIYPVFGSWAWGGLLHGGGWLEKLSTGAFCDFAGSTVVHSVGGWLALAGAIVLGPRVGKYGADGKPRAIPGHNIPLAALGVFILWFGWFGFNAGSAISSNGLAASAFVVTNTAAASAALMWTLISWYHKRPSVIGTATGAVVGLVAITPASGFVTPISAIVIGAVAAVISYCAILLRLKYSVDESLDVWACHGMGGTWGAIATGIFATTLVNPAGADGLLYGNAGQLVTQIVAVGVTWVYAFVVTYILAKIIDSTIGLRVSEEEEAVGLDIAQHAEKAYA